ncbi:MAG: effector binding domain-containing protein [Clostridia bacterium]|nr:effector binding domain-containing protein [Clostridia bacterium]
MELQSISKVSKKYNISARTLRYYEQLGLICPVRDEENSYRIYDEETLRTLQQIIILRKLRIPLKQIADILKSDSAKTAIDIFEENLVEIDGEITALSTIRSIIKSFLNKLQIDDTKFMLPDDENLMDIVDSLTVTKINFKEEKNLEELNRASEKVNKLTDKDIRILYLPPATVASVTAVCDNPEEYTGGVIDRWAESVNLFDAYPAARHYGSNADDENGNHGYERWITIPDDMEIAEPLTKKYFEGGLYAAHTITMGNFEEWEWLVRWVAESDKYEMNLSDRNGCSCGLLEEHLNYVYYYNSPDRNDETSQLDLLIAIKEK